MLLIHENGVIDLEECFKEVGRIQIRIERYKDIQDNDLCFYVKILMKRAGFFHDAEEVIVSTTSSMEKAVEIKKKILIAYSKKEECFSLI